MAKRTKASAYSIRKLQSNNSQTTRSRLPLYLLGASIYVSCAAVSFLYYSPEPKYDTPKSTIHDELAETYDKNIDSTELWVGIKGLRWWYIKNWAQGNVIEVACGTGRNLNYYDSNKVTQLTMVDPSIEMLRKLSEKDQKGIVTEFIRGSVEELSGQYDTVVQTFGLCSVSDPSVAARKLVDLVKPGGKLILLEHGLGTWGVLNHLLKKYEGKHAELWGCWWGRDIEKAIDEMKDINWQVRKRWHLGTTWVLVGQKTA